MGETIWEPVTRAINAWSKILLYGCLVSLGWRGILAKWTCFSLPVVSSTQAARLGQATPDKHGSSTATQRCPVAQLKLCNINKYHQIRENMLTALADKYDHVLTLAGHWNRNLFWNMWPPSVCYLCQYTATRMCRFTGESYKSHIRNIILYLTIVNNDGVPQCLFASYQSAIEPFRITHLCNIFVYIFFSFWQSAPLLWWQANEITYHTGIWSAVTPGTTTL